MPAHIFAKLKNLGIDFSPGDANGRRWLCVRGQVRLQELMKIFTEVKRPEQIR